MYRVLGVHRSASHGDVRKAWRRKSLVWHPDKARSLSFTRRLAMHWDVLTLGIDRSEVFHKLTEAYETLSDRDTRLRYNVRLDACLAEERRQRTRAHTHRHAFEDVRRRVVKGGPEPWYVGVLNALGFVGRKVRAASMDVSMCCA